jgi:ATP-dependent 26S proteasome regulatory subunit
VQDHEATAMMKAQFMTLWDGLNTDSECTVIVMGATNRPHDLDRAILRRMPATFHITLPVSDYFTGTLPVLPIVGRLVDFFPCRSIGFEFYVII